VARKRRNASKLPLDDPRRWMPLADVHKALCPSTGHPELAARDLTEAMAKPEPDGVRSMRRRFARVPDGANPDDYPERELMSWAFWAEEHELLSTSDTLMAPDGLLIGSRARHGQIMTADAARGYAFFAWRPDLEKAWPTIFVAAEEPKSAPSTRSSDRPADDDDKPRRKPGPKPKHDWKTQVTRELIRRARAGKRDPTAPEMLQWCENNLGSQPDIRQMQKLLRDLLA